MRAHPTKNAERFVRAAGLAAATAVALAAAILTGWMLDVSGPAAIRVWQQTKPLAAGMLLALAGAAWLLRDPENLSRGRAGRWLAAAAFAIGALSLAEYAAGVAVPLGRWLNDALFAGRIQDPRMPPYTAVCVTLQALALLLVDARPAARHSLAQWMSLAPLAVSMLVLIGHAYGVPSFYRPGSLSPMGALTAVAMILIAFATTFCRPQFEPIALFAADHAGGYMARRVVPAAIVFPIAFGWLRLAGEHAGFYGTELGLALFCVATVLFFSVLVASVARRLGVIDELRAESAALLRGVIANSSDFIAVLDTRMRYLAFNDSHRREFRALYGTDARVGLSMLEPIEHLPQDHAATQALWARALGGESFVVVHEFGDARRVRRWYEISFNPIRDAEGRVIAAAQIVRDMTERRAAQEQLQAARDRAERSRAEQEAIVQSMTEGVVVFAPQGRLVEANPAALSILGFGRMEELRRSIAENPEAFDLRDLEGRSVPPEQWPIARVLRGETFTGAELQVRRADGSFSMVGCFGGAPVRDAHGRIQLAVCTLRDITKERQAEQQLADALRQIERHSQNLEQLVAERTSTLTETVNELERFSYSLSHDLRAPLRAMKGFSQILQSDYGERLGDQGGFYLERIATAAGRLDQLIQDVLTYSCIVRQRVKLDPIDPERLVRQLIEESPALQPPRAQIAVASPLLPMLGHEAYLTQVLSNLLYNAVKFVAPGVQPQVRVSTERAAGDRVRLLVRDNGIGIAKAAQPRLFGMFERLTNGYEGTGIGLSIVRKAVERMGGEVGVDSAENQGSTFWIQLAAPKPP